MDLSLNHFVFRRKALRHFIQDQHNLGPHTDIVEFTTVNIMLFKWTHPAIRPMGSQISKQCPNVGCKRLKTRIPKISKCQKLINLVCKVCKHSEAFMFPDDWSWVQGNGLHGDSRGAWMYRMENAASKNDDDVEMT
jgi:hypothetical protein